MGCSGYRKGSPPPESGLELDDQLHHRIENDLVRKATALTCRLGSRARYSFMLMELRIIIHNAMLKQAGSSDLIYLCAFKRNDGYHLNHLNQQSHLDDLDLT